ncbi:MAG: hypothetical protein JWM36_2099 [Hyphomicrobiales bacterium]|nr:hypothetical protein [Hyphomicrobiales bacterium]
MARAETPNPNEPPRNASQVRGDIDSGKTGEKVAFPDPAAAPMGTDDEAGGTSALDQAAALSAAPELPAATLPSGKHFSPVWAMVIAGALVIAAAIAALYWRT